MNKSQKKFSFFKKDIKFSLCSKSIQTGKLFDLLENFRKEVKVSLGYALNATLKIPSRQTVMCCYHSTCILNL